MSATETQTSTELAVVSHGSNILTADSANAVMAFATSLGRQFAHAGVGGCQTEAQGTLLAMVCAMRSVDPFRLLQDYHLIGGKLSKKPESMLIDFENSGGKFDWIEDGSNGIKATLECSKGGKVKRYSFSIDDAKQAGLVKGGSTWTKGPVMVGAMLRARCVSGMMRAHFPSISAGCYTPEELQDVEDEQEPKTRARKQRTPEEVEARRKELEAASVVTPVAVGNPIVASTREPGDETENGEVIDASFTVTGGAADQVPFDVPGEKPAVAPVVAPVSPQPIVTPAKELIADVQQDAEALEKVRLIKVIEEKVKKDGGTVADLVEYLKSDVDKSFTSLEVVPLDKLLKISEML